MTNTSNTTEEELAANAVDEEQDDPYATTEWEVRCAGVTYFEAEVVMGPHGRPLTDRRSGEELVSIVRKNAIKGQKIQLTDYEAARLLKEEAIQEPGSALIRGLHQNAPTLPTPFGVPIRPEGADSENPITWTGPVMGDPRPIGGATDVDIATGAVGGSFTPEQIAELQNAQRTLEGKNDPEQDPELTSDEQDSFASYSELDKDDLEAEVAARNESRDEGDQIEVTRRDGKDGKPLKDDYAFALAKDDTVHKEDED